MYKGQKAVVVLRVGGAVAVIGWLVYAEKQCMLMDW